MTPPHEEYRARLLRRLAVVVDEGKPHGIRRAAVVAVQSMLRDGNPLKAEDPDNLLERTLPAWGNRLYLIAGRRRYARVQRPPTALSDVWAA
jgi:hypothetical protein